MPKPSHRLPGDERRAIAPCLPSGCVAQRESTSFTPRGSQVQSLSHPPFSLASWLPKRVALFKNVSGPADRRQMRSRFGNSSGLDPILLKLVRLIAIALNSIIFRRIHAPPNARDGATRPQTPLRPQDLGIGWKSLSPNGHPYRPVKPIVCFETKD